MRLSATWTVMMMMMMMTPWLTLLLLLEIVSAGKVYPSSGGDQYSASSNLVRDLAMDNGVIGGLADYSRDHEDGGSSHELKLLGLDNESKKVGRSRRNDDDDDDESALSLEEQLKLWGVDTLATTTPRAQRGDIEVVQRDDTAARGDVPGPNWHDDTQLRPKRSIIAMRKLLWEDRRAAGRWYSENEGLLPSDGLMQSDEPSDEQQQQQQVKQPSYHHRSHHRHGEKMPLSLQQRQEEQRRRHWEEQERRRVEEERRRSEEPSQRREEERRKSEEPSQRREESRPDSYEERLAAWQRKKEEHDRLVQERENSRRRPTTAPPPPPQQQQQQQQQVAANLNRRPTADEERENEMKLQDYIRRNTPIVVAERGTAQRGSRPPPPPPPEPRGRHPPEQPARMSHEDARFEEYCRRVVGERRNQRVRYDAEQRRRYQQQDNEESEVERCVSGFRRMHEEERRREQQQQQQPAAAGRRWESETKGRGGQRPREQLPESDEYQRPVPPDEETTMPSPSRGVSRVHQRLPDVAPRGGSWWAGTTTMMTSPPSEEEEEEEEGEEEANGGSGRRIAGRNRGQTDNGERKGWPQARREQNQQEPRLREQDAPVADRYAEYKKSEDSMSRSRFGPDEQRRRHDDDEEEEEEEEEERRRLQLSPVSAAIIIRANDPAVKANANSSNMASPQLSARMATGSEIDFLGLSPNKKGLDAPGFPSPATKRPPAPSPEPCVWALVVCCKNTRDPSRLPRCFEATNCPTFDTASVCEADTVRSANNEIMRFYLQAASPPRPKQIVYS